MRPSLLITACLTALIGLGACDDQSAGGPTDSGRDASDTGLPDAGPAPDDAGDAATDPRPAPNPDAHPDIPNVDSGDDTPDPDAVVSLLDLCEETWTRLAKIQAAPDLIDQLCLLGALAAGSVSDNPGAVCEELYDACVEDPALIAALIRDLQEQSGGCPEELADCTLTRAQLDACALEQSERIQEVLPGLACDGDLEAFNDALLELGPACLAVQSACDTPPPDGGYTYQACASDFVACGGDPAGDWTFDDVCIEPADDAFDELLAICPGSSLTGSATASGTLSLERDGPFRRQLELVKTLDVQGPRACIDELCDAVYARFECNNRTSGPTGCSCTARASSGIGAPGWIQEGSVFQHASGARVSWSFCRDGDTLTVVPSGDFGQGLVPRMTLHRAQ